MAPVELVSWFPRSCEGTTERYVSTRVMGVGPDNDLKRDALHGAQRREGSGMSAEIDPGDGWWDGRLWPDDGPVGSAITVRADRGNGAANVAWVRIAWWVSLLLLILGVLSTACLLWLDATATTDGQVLCIHPATSACSGPFAQGVRIEVWTALVAAIGAAGLAMSSVACRKQNSRSVG